MITGQVCNIYIVLLDLAKKQPLKLLDTAHVVEVFRNHICIQVDISVERLERGFFVFKYRNTICTYTTKFANGNVDLWSSGCPLVIGTHEWEL